MLFPSQKWPKWQSISVLDFCARMPSIFVPKLSQNRTVRTALNAAVRPSKTVLKTQPVPWEMCQISSSKSVPDIFWKNVPKLSWKTSLKTVLYGCNKWGRTSPRFLCTINAGRTFTLKLEPAVIDLGFRATENHSQLSLGIRALALLQLSPSSQKEQVKWKCLPQPFLTKP